jgi:hypothetical protein
MSPANPTISSPITLTVTFTNNTGSPQSGFGVSFNPLPIANVGPGVMTIAPSPNVVNQCNGSAVNAIAGKNKFEIAGVSLLTGSCTVTVNLSASGTGLYVLKNYTFIDATSATGLPAVPMAWGDNDSNDLINVVPPGDELYAPEPAGTTQPYQQSGGLPVSPGVQVFNATTGALDCTIASSTNLPDPTVVAVSPYNGTIYVYDHQKQAVNVFPYQSGCKGGVSLNLTPQSIFGTEFPVAGLAVASNGELVVSGNNNKSNAYEMNGIGAQDGPTIPSYGDVADVGNNLYFESGSGPECNGTMGGCSNPTITVTKYTTVPTSALVTQFCSSNVEGIFPGSSNSGSAVTPTMFFHMAAAGGYIYLITDVPSEGGTNEGPGGGGKVPLATAVTSLFLVEPCGATADYTYTFTTKETVGTSGPSDLSPTTIAADPQTQGAAFGAVLSLSDLSQLRSISLSAIENNGSPGVLFPASIPGPKSSSGMAYGW